VKRYLFVGFYLQYIVYYQLVQNSIYFDHDFINSLINIVSLCLISYSAKECKKIRYFGRQIKEKIELVGAGIHVGTSLFIGFEMLFIAYVYVLKYFIEPV
jgi:hypothetical protein